MAGWHTLLSGYTLANLSQPFSHYDEVSAYCSHVGFDFFVVIEIDPYLGGASLDSINRGYDESCQLFEIVENNKYYCCLEYSELVDIRIQPLFGETYIPYVPTEITTSSNPVFLKLSLSAYV
ncbi:hypothetical protein Tco_0995251 [Tanacetum coccineum]